MMRDPGTHPAAPFLYKQAFRHPKFPISLNQKTNSIATAGFLIDA
jgi:hypothetical protein